jgi:hypothetical protein
VKAKGLARLVKWWRDLDRYGATFDAAEQAEIAAALGRDFAAVAEARAALAQAVAGRAIAPEAALRLVHAQVSRQNRIMADAMGSLARTGFAPLQ